MDHGIRKKMRKGTHSCFECRRRKIRCIFSPDNPSICTECFARGSRCIDQEHADSDVIVDHRKNLRERVARLEALVNSLVEEKSNAGEALRNLGSVPRVPPASQSGDSPSSIDVVVEHTKAPVMMMFDNAVLARPKGPFVGASPADSVSSSECTATSKPAYHDSIVTTNFAKPAGVDGPGSQPTSKTNQTRQELLSVLPPYNELLDTLKTDDQWWEMTSHKCPGTRLGESIEQFANRVLDRGTPCEMGSLVLCYGMCAEGNIIDRCLYAVDRWIVSDDEYMGTLDGLECSMLQAKVYADIGQARRAWLTFRRAIGFAQLMGLHRNRNGSHARESIWWSLYQGDKLMSLMLGLPYAISDEHCNMEMDGRSIDDVFNSLTFIAKIAQFARKVIDKIQAIKEFTFSSLMDLDQEMDAYATKIPPDWRNVPPFSELTDPTEWQGKILSMMCFHQTRVFLHMPFMLKSITNSGYDCCRDACIGGAREMLRLYHMLRAPGIPAYACKAVDFVGFTASVLVILGLLGYGRTAVHDPEQDELDWRLIDTSIEILKRASSEKGGKVAEQSYQALEQLSQVHNFDCAGPDLDGRSTKIAIPFFGTISVQRGKSFRHLAVKPSPPSQPPSLSSGTAPTTPSFGEQLSINNTASSGASSSLQDNSLIAYDGFYMPPTAFDASQQSSSTNGAIPKTLNWPVASGFLWENVGNMDIDQDWGWFMNDLDLQQPQPQVQTPFTDYDKVQRVYPNFIP